MKGRRGSRLPAAFQGHVVQTEEHGTRCCFRIQQLKDSVFSGTCGWGGPDGNLLGRSRPICPEVSTWFCGQLLRGPRPCRRQATLSYPRVYLRPCRSASFPFCFKDKLFNLQQRYMIGNQKHCLPVEITQFQWEIYVLARCVQ